MQESVLPCLTASDGEPQLDQDPGFWCKLALRFDMAFGPGAGEKGGLCDPGLCSRKWNPSSSAHGLSAPGDFGCRTECKFNGGCRSFDNVPMSWGSRGREWRRGPLLGGHPSESSGIRPGDGYLRYPAFLARDAGDFAFISFPSGSSLRVDFKGIRHEGPVLLGGRGRCSLQDLCPAGCKEGSIKAQEGYHRSPSRPACCADRGHPCVDVPNGEAPCRPCTIGRSGHPEEGNCKACSPDGFPMPGLSGSFGLVGFCKSRWASTPYQNCHAPETDDSPDVPRRRADCPTRSRWLSSCSACSSWRSCRWSCNSGFDPTKPGYDYRPRGLQREKSSSKNSQVAQGTSCCRWPKLLSEE